MVSADGKKYRRRVHQAALVHRFPRFGAARLRVVVEAYVPDNRRRDLDNVFKASLDALQSAGVYDDDGQIDDLRIIRKHRHENGALVVCIEKLDSPAG